MNFYDVTVQLVDSSVDESGPGGEIAADKLVEAFHKFPFAEEVARGLAMEDGVTFPTIIFKRQSDAEEIAIWTENADRFDLCFVHGGKKRFLNNQSKDEVETILCRFATESVLAIQPRSFWSRLFR
ncbi:MAG TPA: hypothetical protein VJU77_11245 [Chthoniobacterales bacterium]|nr:hypothetical protein [Chthoniobacterales bacterium]